MQKESNDRAEVWKISARDRLSYYSDKTSNSEIPVDLLNPKSESIKIDLLYIGQQISLELEQVQKEAKLKTNELEYSHIGLELHKNFENLIDNLYYLTFNTHD